MSATGHSTADYLLARQPCPLCPPERIVQHRPSAPNPRFRSGLRVKVGAGADECARLICWRDGEHAACRGTA